MLAKPLPRRVRHKEFETGLSLALRLAHRHGDTWKAFAGATGLPISGLRMSEHLPQLSACSSVEAERIGRWTPAWLGHDVEVLGHHFDRSRFLRLNLRICPHCMEEDVSTREAGERAEDAAYLRLDWCLAFVFGCERHRVHLVTRCPVCGARPKWKVGRIDACHCGASLLGRRPDGLTTEEMDVLRMLGDRLHGRPPAGGVPTMTAGVPLGDLVNLLRLLGQVSLLGRDVSDNACALEVENLSEILVHGARAIEALPGSFERLLDSLAAEGPGPHRGPREVYGLPILRWMRSDRPFVAVLRPVFHDHAARNSTLPRQRDTGERPSAYRRRAARGRRLLTPAEMERFAAAVDWTGGPAVQREQVTTLFPQALVGQLGAAAHLGITWRRFVRLEQAGMVSPAWVREENGPRYYYLAELNGLLERLRGGAARCQGVGAKLLSLPALAQLKGVDSLDLIIDLLEGRLGCRGVLAGVGRVPAVLVDPGDVRSRRDKRPPGALPKSTVRQVLGLDLEAWSAVDGVLLRSVRRGFNTYVDWEDIQRFDEAFMSVIRMASLLGSSTPKLRRSLDLHGAADVMSGRCFAIYSRQHAEEVFPRLAGVHVDRTCV